jgi:hypothetical protein
MPGVASPIEQHHVLAYSNAVKMVAQQMKNPLMGSVTSVSATGEAQSASDLIGSVEYQYGEARSRTNVENPVTGTRRWLVRPDEIKSGQYIDDEDKLDTAGDPTSKFVQAHTTAVLRGCMDRIMGTRKVDGVYRVVDGGIMGSATEGKRPGALTALPGAQVIPKGATGMTIDKMRLARLTMNQKDFGLEDDDPLYCAISPLQADDLLGIAAASGVYLNAFNIEQLRSGKPTGLLGFSWIVTNRVPKDNANNWMCPVWTKANIVEGVWQEIDGQIWNDSHADNKPYCRVRTRRDVVRLEDAGVVVITC